MGCVPGEKSKETAGNVGSAVCATEQKYMRLYRWLLGYTETERLVYKFVSSFPGLLSCNVYFQGNPGGDQRFNGLSVEDLKVLRIGCSRPG